MDRIFEPEYITRAVHQWVSDNLVAWGLATMAREVLDELKDSSFD